LIYIDECSIRDIQRECANPYWSIISEETLEKLFDFAEHRYIPYDLGMTLSVVERAILNRARQGMGNEDIARSLCISVNTVKTHRKNIFRKLQVESITEALAVVGNYQLI